MVKGRDWLPFILEGRKLRLGIREEESEREKRKREKKVWVLIRKGGGVECGSGAFIAKEE